MEQGIRARVGTSGWTMARAKGIAASQNRCDRRNRKPGNLTADKHGSTRIQWGKMRTSSGAALELSFSGPPAGISLFMEGSGVNLSPHPGVRQVYSAGKDGKSGKDLRKCLVARNAQNTG